MPDYVSARVEAVLKEMKKGNMVILYDQKDMYSPDAEGEGDIVLAAKDATIKKISDFLDIAHAGGTFCISMDAKHLTEMGIPLQIRKQTNPRSPKMYNTVDSIRAQTGISAEDYSYTVEDLINGRAEKLLMPGHLTPLGADPDGLFGRKGHTEASYHLIDMAEIMPKGALIMEIMRHGERVSGDALTRLAKRNEIPMATINDVLEYSQKVGYRPGTPKQ